jgi:superfamily II helicase
MKPFKYRRKPVKNSPDPNPHKKLIIKLREQGFTYRRISETLRDTFGESISAQRCHQIYRKHLQLLDIVESTFKIARILEEGLSTDELAKLKANAHKDKEWIEFLKGQFNSDSTTK